VPRIRRFVLGAVAVAAVATIPLTAAHAISRGGGVVADAAGGSVGTYQPIAPVRLLDTRGTGPVGAGQVVHLQVAGQGGVPASGVSAVVLNVTETGATEGGFVTVYPTGVTRPTVSNLNFASNTTLANSVTVTLGAGGQVDLYNNAGNTQLLADVTGYFVGDATLPIGGQYQLVKPQRLLDTRSSATLKAGTEITVPIDYGANVNPHIRALAVNITSVGSAAGGFLTAWNGTGKPPTTSTLNFAKGATVPNMAIVPTAPCTFASCSGLPSITIFNGSGGSTNVLVDVTGVFDDGTLPGGMLFHPITPTRIADTRIGLGAPAALGAGKSVNVTPPGSIVDNSTGALAVNVTAVSPTASTWLTLWPTNVTRPTVSTLNPSARQTVANAAIITLGDGKAFSVYNNAGTTNFLVDVAGTYELAAP